MNKLIIIAAVFLFAGGAYYANLALPRSAQEKTGAEKEQRVAVKTIEDDEAPVAIPTTDEEYLSTETPKILKVEPKAIDQITTKAGRITKDEIWSGEIQVKGDIEVARGTTLTIEPGTLVRVAAHADSKNLFLFPLFDLKSTINTTKDYDQYVHRNEPYRDEGNHVSIRIKGTLEAVGTPENGITITSASSTPSRYDWNVFAFEKGRMEYVTMEYYRAFSPGNGTLVSRSVFRHVGECGICANSTAVVEYNTAFDTGHEIVDMHDSSPTIRFNTLGPAPEKSGIIIDGGSPTIIGNRIFNVRDGINFISPPDNPIIKDNIFESTEEDIAHNY